MLQLRYREVPIRLTLSILAAGSLMSFALGQQVGQDLRRPGAISVRPAIRVAPVKAVGLTTLHVPTAQPVPVSGTSSARPPSAPSAASVSSPVARPAGDHHAPRREKHDSGDHHHGKHDD